MVKKKVPETKAKKVVKVKPPKREWTPYGRIVVAGVQYSVLLIDGLRTDKGIYGMCDADTFEIHIDSALSERQLKLTLVHELSHAVFNQSGLNRLVHGKVEEAIVSAFEHWLYTVVDWSRLGNTYRGN